MQGPNDYAWPVSYRFHIDGPWGRSQYDLTVDVPALAGLPVETGKFGRLLWLSTVAHATSILVNCWKYEAWAWKSAAGFCPPDSPPGVGFRLGAAAGRLDAGCVMMHTGHLDHYALRRLAIGGIPAAWVNEGLLTRAGMGALESLAQTWLIGLRGVDTGGPAQWLLAYPHVVQPGLGNFFGVGLRRVDFLRVTHHTTRAPEPAGSPWP